MKTILIIMALCCATCAHAQTLTINNNSWGDIYATAYAHVPGCSGTYVDQVVPVLVTAGTSITVGLTTASSWMSSTVPTGPYDLVYGEVYRDPTCPGTFGWGAYVQPCGAFSEFYDFVTVGDAACFYDGQACLTVTVSTPSCNGFSAGDTFPVVFTPAGSSATIDAN